MMTLGEIIRRRHVRAQRCIKDSPLALASSPASCGDVGEVCDLCEGTGRFRIVPADECAACAGTGVKRPRRAAAEEGDTLTVLGRCACPPLSGAMVLDTGRRSGCGAQVVPAAAPSSSEEDHLRRQVKRAVEALRKYGQHQGPNAACDIAIQQGEDCPCGLTAALRSAGGQ